MTPVMQQCRGPGCRAWSPEVARGKACPYCGASPRLLRFSRAINWLIVITSAAVLASHIIYWTGSN